MVWICGETKFSSALLTSVEDEIRSISKRGHAGDYLLRRLQDY